MNSHETEDRDKFQGNKEDPPPFFRTWNRIYIAIALYTCILTLALYLISISLNR